MRVSEGVDHVAGAAVWAADRIQPSPYERDHLQYAMYRADEKRQTGYQYEFKQVAIIVFLIHYSMTSKRICLWPTQQMLIPH